MTALKSAAPAVCLAATEPDVRDPESVDLMINLLMIETALSAQTPAGIDSSLSRGPMPDVRRHQLRQRR